MSISRGVRVLTDLIGKRDEIIGRVGHRRNDDHHVVARMVRIDHTPGDIVDVGGCRNRCATELLDDEGHGRASVPLALFGGSGISHERYRRSNQHPLYHSQVATDKRDRQRANRDARRAVERKQQRRSKILVRGRRIAIWVVIAIVLIVIANVIAANSADNAVGPSLIL